MPVQSPQAFAAHKSFHNLFGSDQTVVTHLAASSPLPGTVVMFITIITGVTVVAAAAFRGVFSGATRGYPARCCTGISDNWAALMQKH
jgi:hypothetical protein